MPKNITMQDLLGNNLNSLDYGVSTNWRIDFSRSKGIYRLAWQS